MDEKFVELDLCMAVPSDELAENWPLAGTGTGYATREDHIYPFPKTYQRSTQEERVRRDQELAVAQQDNWFNADLLPGAVVHGNIGSQDVVQNSAWAVRGTESQRQAHAQEDQIGSDDRDPGEDGIDVYESMFHYFEKNCELWATSQDGPSKVQRLLEFLTYNTVENEDLQKQRMNVLDPVLMFAPEGRSYNIDHYDFYPDPYPDRYPKQPFDAEFRDDDVVAWIQLAYSSPFYRIEPYKERLAKFAVTDAQFTATEAFKNDNFDQAIAEGRVFIVDFAEFHEFNTREPANQSRGARFYTPMALFAVPKQGGQLKIVAIQSTQHAPQSAAEREAWKTNNTQDPSRPLSDILTPADDYWSWQMAKNVFTSMYAVSSVVDHLSMHVYLGPIPVSFYRNIPKQHPLSPLLDTHLMSLARNNHAGIFWESGTQTSDSYAPADKGLLTGMFNKVSGWTGQTFIDACVSHAGVYDWTKHSNVMDRSKDRRYAAIDDFPVVDDNGILPIVTRWVDGYIRLYYRSDADVKNDHELQSFCSECANDGRVAGFPESVSSVDELIDMAARIIYWMTANHTLEATLGCEKLAPLGYWSDRVPRNDEIKTEKDWFDVMPPINIGLGIFCVSRIFVDLPRDWYRSLGRFPDGQFMHDRRVYQHLQTFQDELLDLDNQIQAKNNSRRWAYTMMRPATMTCSPWN